MGYLSMLVILVVLGYVLIQNLMDLLHEKRFVRETEEFMRKESDAG